MTEEFCPMESSVLLARRTGQWTETQQRHIAECANCQESLAVAGFMTGVADRLRNDETLPGPTLVWLKAQWIEREARQRRHLVRTAIRRAVVQAGVALILAVIVLATSDGVIGFTLKGTFAFLILGGFFLVTRRRIPILRSQ